MRLFSVLACCALTPASAATFTGETSQSVFIIRTFERFGNAVTEFIGEPDTHYRCMAFGVDGAPLGTAEAAAGVGEVAFENVRADDVHSVSCKASPQ